MKPLVTDMLEYRAQYPYEGRMETHLLYNLNERLYFLYLLLYIHCFHAKPVTVLFIIYICPAFSCVAHLSLPLPISLTPIPQPTEQLANLLPVHSTYIIVQCSTPELAFCSPASSYQPSLMLVHEGYMSHPGTHMLSLFPPHSITGSPFAPMPTNAMHANKENFYVTETSSKECNSELHCSVQIRQQVSP